ncbi:MAG: hypothetical protein JRJ43_05375 [Deltaproteobacteria bacterium]|nr:hypothetical protein [Deltaproteobacteria bacterium]MBW1932612.1 hypothetical protein [Deltaproteobacteria bacterium]MBW1937808.1 hypothetical protein [Deltaproteobacteria bacterium]MBW1964499.1 hypothetical protein [Deltaproteobacteria bacterium]MBW2080845.1 hypothetical protein [Deltaproteobacteria bacterium]
MTAIEVHDIKFAKEIIQQVITNLGDHTKIASIAIDRGFMDGALLRWLNSEDIIFYIPAKSSSVLRHKIRLRLLKYPDLLLTQALVSCNRKTSFIPPCPDGSCSICILDQGRII